jgi:hypothetical protein
MCVHLTKKGDSSERYEQSLKGGGLVVAVFVGLRHVMVVFEVS